MWVSSLLLLTTAGWSILSVPAHGWHPYWPHETADKHILARIITMETIDHESSLSQTPLETVWCQSTTDPWTQLRRHRFRSDPASLPERSAKRPRS